MQIIHSKLQLVLTLSVAVATLASLTGCPAQGACPPCFIGGVQAPDSRPNPAPNATINLQLHDSYGRYGAVSEVNVTVTDATGGSETHSYGSDKVGSLGTTTMLTINDNELYDVSGQAPSTAEVEIVFANGKTATDQIDVRTE